MSFAPKPTGLAAIDSAHPLAAGLKSLVLFNEGRGAPRELVTNTPGYLYWSPSSSNQRMASQAAAHPVWDATAFPHATGGSDVAMRFHLHSPMIGFGAGSGFNVAATAAAPQRTMFALYKLASGNFGFGVQANQCILSNGVGGGDVAMVAQPYTGGSGLGPGTNWAAKFLRAANTFEGPTGDLVLFPDRWLLTACSFDDSGGSGSYKRRWRHYDLSTGANFTIPELTGLTTSWGGMTGNSQYLYAAGSPQNAFTSGFNGWLGMVGLHAGYWDDATWNALIADPFAVARGSYAGAGTAVKAWSTDGRTAASAGILNTWSRTTTTVEFSITRPKDGAGTITYQLERSASGGTTDAGPVAFVGTDVAGKTAPMGIDTPGGRGPWWYRMRVSDGTNTSYSNVVPVALDGSEVAKVSLVGESVLCQRRDMIHARLSAMTRGRVLGANHGRDGWSTNTVQPNTYVLLYYGMIDGGTYRLSHGVGGPETPDIAWNATPAQIQAALRTIAALGTAATQVAGSSAAPASGGIGIIQPAGSAPWAWDAPQLVVSNNALTSTSTQPFGLSLYSPIRFIADFNVALGCNLLTVGFGGNDAAAAASSSYTIAAALAAYKQQLKNAILYLRGRGFTLLVDHHMTIADTEAKNAYVAAYAGAVSAAVSEIADPLVSLGTTEMLPGSMRMFDLLSGAGSPAVLPQNQGTTVVHPTANGLDDWLADYQAESIAKAMGIAVGASGGGNGRSFSRSMTGGYSS